MCLSNLVEFSIVATDMYCIMQISRKMHENYVNEIYSIQLQTKYLDCSIK